jgi:hypothetical protein
MDPERLVLAKFNVNQITANGVHIAFPELSVFPNPGNESIKFTGLDNNTRIEFLNPLGQMVKLIFPTTREVRISVEEMQLGAYFIHFQSDKGKKTLKWIKE